MSELKDILCEETESREMYLKTIYLLHSKHGNVRVIDVAEKLGYAKSSVSRMIKYLRQDGYVQYTETNNIVLTDKGYGIAVRLNEKYEFFHARLLSKGVAPDRAYETACRMEHVIPDDVYETLKTHTAQM